MICLMCCRKGSAFPCWHEIRYPLFFLEDLDSKRPNKVQLLGKDIVIWKAPGGSWSALKDLCSHRLAPLSGAAVLFGAQRRLCLGHKDD